MNETKIQLTLLLLSLSYAVFTIPLLPVELGGLLSPFYSMVFYSFYWWMYGLNVVIYVATSRDFREMYRIFLQDMFAVTVVRLRDGVRRRLGRLGSWSPETVRMEAATGGYTNHGAH